MPTECIYNVAYSDAWESPPSELFFTKRGRMEIGLVLSGGLAKGAYQIGALRALDEFVPPEEIKVISFASIGALNGYAYSVGRLDEAERMWREACSDKSQRNIVKFMRSPRLSEYADELGKLGSSSRSHVYCSLYDFDHSSVTYKNIAGEASGDIPDYLRASVALPPIMRAVKIGGTNYLDGGVIDNIPVFPLLDHELDYIICVYFDERAIEFERESFDDRIIKVSFPDKPGFGESFYLRESSLNEMISTGYDTAKGIFSAVFSNGYTDTDSVLEGIRRLNASAGKPKLRLTVDVLASNLNRFAQKFAARRIIR